MDAMTNQSSISLMAISGLWSSSAFSHSSHFSIIFTDLPFASTEGLASALSRCSYCDDDDDLCCNTLLSYFLFPGFP